MDDFLSVRGRGGGGRGQGRAGSPGGESVQSSPMGEIAPRTPGSPSSRLPMMLGSHAAHGAEVEEEISHSLSETRNNRARVEAMREQLREYERVTADNAKEIKALRAERFQLIHTDAESQPFPATEHATEVEDESRAQFSSRSYPIPHVDVADLDEPHLPPTNKASIALGPASEKLERDGDVASDEDSDVECLLHMHSKWDEDALGNKEDDDDEDGAASGKVETLRPWLANVFAPKGKAPKPEAGPRWRLLLERVSGYSGSHRSNVVLCLASEEIIYPAGCIAVVASDVGREHIPTTQRFFTGHSNEIGAICVHPDGQTVASGDVGIGSRVCVWDSDVSSMDLLAMPIEGERLHQRGVRCMCFSKDGRHLISVGAEHEHMVAVVDWKSGQVVCLEKGDVNPIVAVRCNPHDGCFVTVGKHHVKFWSIKVVAGQEQLPGQASMSVWQRGLECKRGVFGRHASDKSRTILCVDFAGPGMSLTGGADGSLLLWKGVMVTSAIRGHEGPITSMWALDGEGVTRVATGGKDGKVKLWVVDSRAVLRPCVSTISVSKGGSCIRSVCWHEPTEDIFVGTSTNSIYCCVADAGYRVEAGITGHRGGAVHAVAAHPTRPVYVSGGSDGLVCLWHSVTGKLLSHVAVDGGSGVLSLAYSPDGAWVAAGMTSQGVQLLSHGDADRLGKGARYGQAMKRGAKSVSFSPDSKMLAVGTEGRKVEVVGVPQMRTKIGTFSGHSGAVTHIDWSRDGKTVASNSDAYELLFWGTSGAAAAGAKDKEGFKARLPAACADVDWATWTLNLGWPVKGLAHSPSGDEMSITSVSRSGDKTVVASGDKSGVIRVSTYPCLSQACLRDELTLHVGGVSSVAFLAMQPDVSGDFLEQTGSSMGGSMAPTHVLVTGGARDGCVLQFTVVQAAEGWKRGEGVEYRPVDVVEEEELPPELVRIIEHAKATRSGMVQGAEGLGDGGGEGGENKGGTDGEDDEEHEIIEAAGPFMAKVCPPTSYEENAKPPDWALDLKRIQGCEGHRMRAGAHFLLDGSVVYASGRYVVLQGRDPGSKPFRPQRVFARHGARVQSLCVHPDGDTVASAEEGRPGRVLVWSATSIQVLSSFINSTAGVCSMAFSPSSGSELYTASNCRGQPLSAWSWHKGKLMACEKVEPEEGKLLLAITASPHVDVQADGGGEGHGDGDGQQLVAVGPKMVRFWRHEGERLRGRHGVSVRDIGVHICAAFGEPGVVFTGTSRGEVWMWHNAQHVQTLPVHEGPVYDMASHSGEGLLATAGHDGTLQVLSWELELVAGLPLEDHAGQMVSCSSIRGGVATGVCWSSQLEALLVSTADNELLELHYTPPSAAGGFQDDLEFHEEDEQRLGGVTDAFIHAQSHSGSLTAVCTHPSKPIAATAGSEGTVRLWEASPDAAPLALVHISGRRHATSMCMRGRSGNALAVGYSDGSIQVWTLDLLQGVIVAPDEDEAGVESEPSPSAGILARGIPQPLSRRRRPITCIRHSPCMRYLAAGTQDGFIDVYDVKKGGEALGSFKGHFGSVTEFDWDSEGRHLKSNSTASELLFWDMDGFEAIKNPLTIRDSPWDTGTCRLTWDTLAAVPSDNAGSLLSVCRSALNDGGEGGVCFAAGYDTGEVRLHRYPAPSAACEHVSYKVGMSTASHLVFSHDDAYVWIGGSEEGGIELHGAHYVRPSPVTTPDIDLILAKPLSHSLHAKNALAHLPPSSPLPSSPGSAGDFSMGMGAVKPYLENVFAPSNPPPPPPPGVVARDLTLEHVYGYRGYDTRSSVVSLASGEAAYLAMGIVVVANVAGDAMLGMKAEKGRQRFFKAHTGDVTCIAAHSDGVRVASADAGSSCCILVWDSSSLAVECRLAGFKHVKKWVADADGISAISFGAKNDKILVALGMHGGLVASVYEWEHSRLLCHVKTGVTRGLLGLAVHPSATRFTTLGIEHIAFWEVGKTKIQRQEHDYAGLATERTMTCASYVQCKGTDSSLLLTGCIDGCVYVWSDNVLSRVSPCHTGAIIDMWMDPSGTLLATGGEDGFVWLWDFDKEDKRLVKRGSCMSEGAQCIRSVAGSASGGGGMLVGTSDGQLAHIGVQEAAKLFEGDMRIAVKGHEAGTVTAIVPHPAQYGVFLTAGMDGTVRMWDSNVRGPACGDTIALPLSCDGDHCTCMDLVPGDGAVLACGMLSGAVVLVRVTPSESMPGTVHGVGPKGEITKAGSLSLVGGQDASGGDAGVKRVKDRSVVSVRFGMAKESVEGGGGQVVLLAVSTDDAVVDVYRMKDVQGGDGGEGVLSHIGACRGHTSDLSRVEIEWDYTGTMMVSACGGEELLFWDMRFESGTKHKGMRPRCRPMRAAEARDASWLSWTLPLGWLSKGVEPLEGEEWSLTSLHGARIAPVCAVGRSDGHLSIFPFPCASSSSHSQAAHPVATQRAHLSPVSCARILLSDSTVISAGGKDGCIAQWGLAKPKDAKKEDATGGSGKDACIEHAVKSLKQSKSVVYAHHSREAKTAEGEEDQAFVSSFHPYLAAIQEKAAKNKDGRGDEEEDRSAPEDELKLEYVLGYNAELLNNLHSLKSGEVIYAVARVCVVLNLTGGRRTQRIFSRHEREVTCLAVHPDGVTVASGEVGEFPTCYVWSSRTMTPMASLKGYHRATLSSICFNGMDSSILAMVGCGERGSNTAFFEWSTGSMMAETDVRSDGILLAKSNPVTGSYVTAGEGYLCFSRLGGRNLTSQACALPHAGEVVCTIEFMGAMEREAMALTAGQRGDIMLWKDERPSEGLRHPLCVVTSAHSGGPVLGLLSGFGGGSSDAHGNDVLSCGKGGRVERWHVQRVLEEGSSREAFELVPKGRLGMDTSGLTDACPCCGDKACVRGMERTTTGTLVLSLGSGVLCELAKGWEADGADSACSIVMEGHSKGAVRALAWHPSLPLLSTCCADGTVKVWNREMRRSTGRASVQDPTAVAFSADGLLVVVGQGNGGIVALKSDTMLPADPGDGGGGELVLKAGRKAISALCFSPNGRMLAAASLDSSIHIFKYTPDARKSQPVLIKRSVCKGGAGGVISMDWATDSTYIMSNTDAFELTLWQVPAAPQIEIGSNYEWIRPAAAPERHGEMDWATKTCVLGWHTQALLHPVADLGLLLSAARSTIGSIFALGDSYGRVLLYRFPLHEPGKHHRTYRGHSEGVACIGFSSDDRHVASGGRTDHALFMWQHRIVPPHDEDDADVASFMHKKSKKQRSSSSKPSPGTSGREGDEESGGGVAEEGEMAQVRPYFGAIFPPSKMSGVDARGQHAAPEEEIEVEHVHGYRGHDSSRNITYLTPDEVLYTAAAAVIILRINENKQRVFSKHSDDVTSVAVHPQRRLMASCQLGEGADVLVWDKRHLSVVATLPLPKGCSATCLSFSIDGENLAIATTGAEENVIVFAWSSGARLAMDAAGKNRIMAIGCHPDEKTIVTCGVRNVTFWTMSKGHLQGREATGGGSKRQTMLCLAFTSDGMTVTGAQNGCIYLWKFAHLERTVVAHRGPLMDIAVSHDGLLTAGKDGLARLWDYDLTASVRIDAGELTHGMLAEGESSGGSCVRAVACIMEESDLEDVAPSRRIAVGMSSNRIIQLIYPNRPHELDSMPDVRILAQGHSGRRLSCLATHPTMQTFATASTDGALRVWDCESKLPVGSVALPKPAGSIAYSPDGMELLIGMGDSTIASVASAEVEGHRSIIIPSSLLDGRIARVLKFSPKGDMLAAGLSNGSIHLFDAIGASSDGKWSLLCTLKGTSSGAVTAIDWSIDGGHIQSNTTGFDLVFWDVRDLARGRELRRCAEVCDLTFSTWTCTMGWPVQGAASDAADLLSAHRSSTGSRLALGRADGTLSISAYPLLSLSAPRLSLHGHSPGVYGVAFTAGNKRVITIGDSDKSVIQWRISQPRVAGGTSSVAGSSTNDDASMADFMVSGVGFPAKAAKKKEGKNKWQWGLVRVVIDCDMGEWSDEMETSLLDRIAAVAMISRGQVAVKHVLAGSVIATLSIRAPDLGKVYQRLKADFDKGGSLAKEGRIVSIVCDCEVQDMVLRLQAGGAHNFGVPLIGGRAGATRHVSDGSVSAVEDGDDDVPDGDVKPYLSAMLPPSSFDASAPPSAEPDVGLELEGVASLGASDSSGNLLHSLRSGEVAYSAVSVAVLLNPENGKQHFFRGHSAGITAMAVHPDGVTIATGDSGVPGERSGAVHVWSSDTLETLASLARAQIQHEGHGGKHHNHSFKGHNEPGGGSVTALSFSLDGTKLLVIDSEMGATLYDWRKKGPSSSSSSSATSSSGVIASTKADKPGHTVMAAASNPYDDPVDETFVTCGVDHLRFWSARGGQLRSTSWLGDTKGRGKLQTMLSLGFSDRGVSLVGTLDGSVYIFRNSTLLRCVDDVHMGPVYCIDASKAYVVTGGGDGNVTRWKFSTRSGGSSAADLTYLKTTLASDLAAGGVHGNTLKIAKKTRDEGEEGEGGVQAPVSVKCVRYRGSGAGVRGSSCLLVATADNSLFEVDDVSNKSRELAGGHAYGRVTGVREHPGNPMQYLTCGEDATVRLWECGTAYPLAVSRMGTPITCIDASPDGAWATVGLTKGGIAVVDTTKLELKTEQPPTRKKGCCTDVMYTPSGHYLACGVDLGIIDLYDVLDGYSLCFTFKGHTSPIAKIDFCHQGRLMRSTSASLELMHWDIDRKAAITHISSVRNTRWETNRCTLGFHARGLVNSHGGDETMLTCTESGRVSARLRAKEAAEEGGGIDVVGQGEEGAGGRVEGFDIVGGALGSGDEPLYLAAGFQWGEIRFVRHPCAHASAGSRSFSGHSSGVSALAVSSDGSRLISSGGPDLTVLVWRMRNTSFPADVETIIRRPESALALSRSRPLPLLQDAPLQGRLPQVCVMLEERLAYLEEHPEVVRDDPVPPNEIEVRRVMGYRGHDSRANITAGRCGDVIYATGATCVTLDPVSGTQGTYLGHAGDVSCMAVHPDGVHIATGEVGPEAPTVCVWECESHRTVACIDGAYTAGGAGDVPHHGFLAGVVSLCFSPRGGNLLCAVGADAHNTIFIIDWRSKEVIQAVRGGPQKVMSCAWSKDDLLVTCGVDHLRFWPLKDAGHKLPSKPTKAIYGKLGRSTTMLCATHVEIKHVGESEPRTVTLTAGVDGSIFAFGSLYASAAGVTLPSSAPGGKVWRPELLVATAMAHHGPVFDMRVHLLSEAQKVSKRMDLEASADAAWVVTGGADGYVRVWEVAASLGRLDKSATVIEFVPVRSMEVEPMQQQVMMTARERQEGEGEEREGEGDDYEDKEDDDDYDGESGRGPASSKGSKKQPQQQILSLRASVKALFPTQDAIAVGTSDNRLVMMGWGGQGEDESSSDLLRQDTLCQAHSKGRVLGLAMHPHLQVCATVGQDMTLRVWQLDSSKQIASLVFKIEPRCIDIAPDGETIAVGMSDGSTNLLEMKMSLGDEGSSGSASSRKMLALTSAVSSKAASPSSLDPAVSLMSVSRIRGEDHTPISCVSFSPPQGGNPLKFYLVTGTGERKAKPGSGGTDMGGDIHLYDASARYLMLETAQQDSNDGHKGDIASFDWSVLPEGYLQSTCAKGKTLFWGPLPSIKRELSLDVLSEMAWMTWRARVGDQVKGLNGLEGSGADVVSVDRTKESSKPVIVVSLRSGRLALAPWPIMDGADSLAKVYPRASMLRKPAIHSRIPCSVRFSPGDRYLVSAGGSDLCISVWRHIPFAPLHDPLLDTLIARASLRSRIDMGANDEDGDEEGGDDGADGAHDGHGKKALSLEELEELHERLLAKKRLVERRERYIKGVAALPPPFEWKQAVPKHGAEQLTPPERVCELEHAYGYRGHDCSRNVRFVQSLEDRRDPLIARWGGEVAYHVGRVGVVHDTAEATEKEEAGKQRYFEGHTKEISCMDVSGDGYKAATGEAGGSSVLVWRFRDLAAIGSLRLPSKHSSGGSACGASVVCFSAKDPLGPLLLVVGDDEDHTVSVFEWEKHQPGQPKFKGPGTAIATRSGDKRAILAVACSKNDVWVTVGVGHIKFWRLVTKVLPPAKGSNRERTQHALEFAKGSWGLLEGQPTTLVSVVCLGDDITVAGDQNGSVFMFSGTRLMNVIRDPTGSSPGVDGAPLAPMFDISVSHVTGAAGERTPLITTGGKDGKARFWSVVAPAMEAGREDQGGGDGGGPYDLELIAEVDVHKLASKAANKAGLRTSFSALVPTPPVSMRSVHSVEFVSAKGDKERHLVCGTSSNEVILVKLLLSGGKLEASEVPSSTRLLCQSHFSGRVADVAPHPSQHVFATCGDDKTVRCWSAKDRNMLAIGKVPKAALCLAWSPRESIDHQIAAGLDDGQVAILVFKLGKHEMAATYLPVIPERPPCSSVCLSFTHDAKYLAIGSSLGHVDIYDVPQAYNRIGMCRASQSDPIALRSISWSEDSKTLMTETVASSLLYWDLVDAANMDCPRVENAERVSKETWASWTSIVGWPVAGVYGGCGGGSIVTAVDSKAEYGGIGRLRIIPGDKDGVNMCAVGDSDGGVRLMRFPALVGGRDHRDREAASKVTGHGTEALRLRFSADGKLLFVACGANLAVMQYRVLHPSEVGQSGKMLKAQQAAGSVVTKLDREMFWKVSVAEIDEMRRRGMPADAVRVREPLVKKMREQRLKVIDWTFERIDLRVVGMEWAQGRLDAQEADDNIIPLQAGATWKQMLMILQEYFGRKDKQGNMLGVTIMYEKYEVAVPMRGRQEMCEKMVKEVVFKGRNQGDIEKIKAESRRTYTVKSELDFRQMFHYCESQYRDLISAGVPFEGQSFEMDVYVIGYQGKKHVASDVASDTVGEMTDGESDLDEVLNNKATAPKKPLGGDDDAEGHGRADFPRDPEPISPTGWDQLVTDLPNEVLEREGYSPWRLEMSYADGYDGKAGRGNLHLLRGGDMLYPTGALCVVHHRNTNSQKIFSKHAPGRVACICVHPGGELVASGETGKSPRLLVWSGHTMQLVCEVKGLLPAPTAEELERKKAGGLAGGSPLGLSCVSFSSGGDPLVVVVAGDAENTVTVVDYKSNEVVATASGGKNKILAVACNTHDRGGGGLTFTTVGVRHLRFWTLSRGRLTSKKGIYTGVPPGSRTMLCVAYTDPTHDTARPEITLTGSKDGKVYIWKDNKACKAVSALEGPIFDMVVVGDQIAIGGKDKQAPLRILTLPRGWPAQVDLVQRTGMHPDKDGHSRAGAGRQLCVRAIAWKGAELLLGSADSSIYAADARTQKCKLAVKGHCGGAILSLAMHPTKQLLFSVGEDGQVRAWDTQQRISGQSRHLRQPLTAVALHPKDGRHVAVGMRSGELAILHSITLLDAEGLNKEVAFGRCEQHSTYRRAAVNAMRYSPDARWLALAVGDGLIDIQDVDAGYRHVRSIQGHWAGVVRLDWGASPISSADAVVWMLQSSGEEREMRHWNLTLKQARNSELTCELIEPEKVRDQHCATWTLPVGWPVTGITEGLSPSGGDADSDDEGAIVDKALGAGAVWQHADAVMCGGGGIGGGRGAGSRGGSIIKLVRWPCFSKSARVKEYQAHSSSVSAIAASEAERGMANSALVASGGLDDGGCIVHWKLVKSEKAQQPRRGGTAAGGGVAASGEGGGDDDMDGGVLVANAEGGARNLSPFVSVSHDFMRVCAVTTDTEVAVFSSDWDTGGSELVCRHKSHRESANGCCFSPASSTTVATASSDRECHVWTVVQEPEGSSSNAPPDSKVEYRLAGQHTKDVVACAVSPDGKRVVTASLDKSIVVWDVGGAARKEVLARGSGHRRPVLCVCWSDDGMRVASGSEDRTVRMWKVPDGLDNKAQDVAEMETENRFKGHEEAVVSISISPPAQQRKLICSASLDETVRVWDVETGDEILTLAHGSALIGCCFSHSGLFVGTLAVDNVTRIFDVSGGSSSLVDDTSGRPPVTAGAVVGAAFRKLDNGQEVLVIAEVRPPNSLVLGREMYLPAPESKTV